MLGRSKSSMALMLAAMLGVLNVPLAPDRDLLDREFKVSARKVGSGSKRKKKRPHMARTFRSYFTRYTHALTHSVTEKNLREIERRRGRQMARL